jgi:cytochrome P450
MSASARAPGLSGLPLIQSANRLKNDSFPELIRLSQSFPNILRFDLFGKTAHMVYHPDYVQRVLKDNVANYPKGPTLQELKGLIGEGLITSEGELWRKQRRTVGQDFHQASLPEYAPIVSGHTTEFLDGWERIRRESGSSELSLEVTDQMLEITLRIAAQTFFGAKIEDAEIISDAVKQGGALIFDRMRSLIKLPRWIPTPRELAFRKALGRMDSFIYALIRGYETAQRVQNNILAKLVASRAKLKSQQQESAMADQQLRDEIVTLLVAGYDTTACTLSWTLHCLATHPEIQEHLAEEIRSKFGGRTPTLADLETIPLARQVIQETLRLWPVVANVDRFVLADDQLGPYFIPKGSVMNVCQYLTHRNPEFWSSPETFDPRRFEPQQVSNRHPFAYFPFGKGPRGCIGEQFALMEAQIILIQILQRYQVRPNPAVPVIPKPRISLFTENGMHLIFRPR